ncbi:hypothetical protein MTR_8g057703 [Medicago truncatula]|uniref:Uncharacterized protein n=1 Tax=Medicago truncatula TaxID=3880 RepID=A0A072TPI8_MEDTR|nr:hypothetical protein MTR_8g057703 [Medicago truncatula]
MASNIVRCGELRHATGEARVIELVSPLPCLKKIAAFLGVLPSLGFFSLFSKNSATVAIWNWNGKEQQPYVVTNTMDWTAATV